MELLLQSLFPSIPAHYLQPEKKKAIVIPYAPDYTPPAKEFITAEALLKIADSMPVLQARSIADSLNMALPLYGLDNIELFEEFLPNIIHESNEFFSKEENLNYRWDRLLEVFPKYFKTPEQAKAYHREPVKIANLVYAGRMGNGSPETNDGWYYRGGGFMQLTGKAVYEAYAAYKGLPVDEVVNLVRESDYYAVDSACWFFCIYKSLKDEAARDEFLKICKAINGGTNGYEERKKYRERTIKFFSSCSGVENAA